MPTIPRSSSFARPPEPRPASTPPVAPDAAGETETATDEHWLRADFGDDEPPNSWALLGSAGEGADLDALAHPDEDEAATRLRWAALPAAQVGTASVEGANGYYHAYAARDPVTGCGWVTCWLDDQDDALVEREFEGTALRDVLRGVLRGCDEEGADLVGERPAPFSAYTIKISRAPKPARAGNPPRRTPAKLTRVALDIEDRGLLCQACARPVWHRGPFTWNEGVYCQELALEPCPHTVLYFTGHSDFATWCTDDLLAKAYAKIEREELPDVTEALQPGGWLWNNGEAVAALAPRLLQLPVTLYQIKSMPEDDFVAVIGTALVAVESTSAG